MYIVNYDFKEIENKLNNIISYSSNDDNITLEVANIINILNKIETRGDFIGRLESVDFQNEVEFHTAKNIVEQLEDKFSYKCSVDDIRCIKSDISYLYYKKDLDESEMYNQVCKAIEFLEETEFKDSEIINKFSNEFLSICY